MTRRLFAGIELAADVRGTCAAAAAQLARTGFLARFEDPAKLHVTLAFLGNVDEARYDEIVAALAPAIAGIAPLRVMLDKLGAFPHERKPRIVYVGAREQGAEFRSLAAAVRAAYEKLGFTFKEDSVAHVTIARVKEPRRALPLVEMPPVHLPVNGVALFESLHDKEANTTRYEIRERATLLVS